LDWAKAVAAAEMLKAAVKAIIFWTTGYLQVGIGPLRAYPAMALSTSILDNMPDKAHPNV
jgi:hypothetical protein